jgi:hypothetical protein
MTLIALLRGIKSTIGMKGQSDSRFAAIPAVGIIRQCRPDLTAEDIRIGLVESLAECPKHTWSDILGAAVYLAKAGQPLPWEKE